MNTYLYSSAARTNMERSGFINNANIDAILEQSECKVQSRRSCARLEDKLHQAEKIGTKGDALLTMRTGTVLSMIILHLCGQ